MLSMFKWLVIYPHEIPMKHIPMKQKPHCGEVCEVCC